MRLYKQTELFLLSSCFLTPLLENSASPFHSPDCSIFCRHGCSVQVLSLHSQGSPLIIFRHVSRGFRSLLLPSGTQGVHLNMLVHSPGSHSDVNVNENANSSEFTRPTQTQGKLDAQAPWMTDTGNFLTLPKFFFRNGGRRRSHLFSNCAVMAYTDGTCVLRLEFPIAFASAQFTRRGSKRKRKRKHKLKKMKSFSFHASTLAFAFSFALE